MMTEKYYTLPSASTYSAIFNSVGSERVQQIKNRLDVHQKPPTGQGASECPTAHVKLLLDQPIIRTYSLYDVQDRIDYFEKKKSFDEIEKGN